MTTLGKALSIRETALKFLTGIEEHFDAASIELPARRYLAPGSPEQVAWDCEQLVVTLGSIGWGQAIDQAQLSPKMAAQASAVSLRHAIISIQLVECTPGFSSGRNPVVPTVEQLHAAGQDYMYKAGLLSQAMVTICAEVRQGLDSGGLVQPGVIDTLGPSGGYHGLETTVALTAATLI